jgi:hypothetical protein
MRDPDQLGWEDDFSGQDVEARALTFAARRLGKPMPGIEGKHSEASGKEDIVFFLSKRPDRFGLLGSEHVIPDTLLASASWSFWLGEYNPAWGRLCGCGVVTHYAIGACAIGPSLPTGTGSNTTL